MAALPVSSRGRRSQDVFHPMDRLFERMLPPDWPGLPWEGHGAEVSYPVDMREEDGKIVVDAEVPGFRADQIDVSVEADRLRIRAERKQEETKGRPHLSERRFARIERVLSLPARVDESKVRARLDNGVLHLEMPELEPSGARRIEIEGP